MIPRLHIRRPSPAMLVALLALFVALGGTAVAATGGNFVLGQANTATTTSALSASLAGKALQVTNTNTGTGATALGLNVATGHVPFTVNSGTKVINLNADKVDGVDSTAFYRAGSKVADSSLFDGHDYASTIADARPQVLLAYGFRGIHQNFAPTFHVPSGGRQLLLTFNASAYSANVTGSAGLCITLNEPGGLFVSNAVCAQAAVNEVNSHKTLVPLPTEFFLPEGDWTATIVPFTGTLTNNDDRYSLVVTTVSQ
jgi:hypothetical protein